MDIKLYTKADYKGKPSTLCPGCGHDSISSRIISACFKAKIPPYKIAKFSGIGCSSKSAAYFLNQAHGFNSLHGRMPSVATGGLTVNRRLFGIGVSGDGDTGNIGMGQFKHLMRRNLPLVYIVENNGVYGLTKGQFSATADLGQTNKQAETNPFPPIDLCMEALIAGCSFVARSFAGDAKQIDTLLLAALKHNGTAMLDIISPCVTFNNTEYSTKSYPYGKKHEQPLHEMAYIPDAEEIQVDYDSGTAINVALHDGSHIRLKKIDARSYIPSSRIEAMKLLGEAQEKQEFITGLLYIDNQVKSWHETMNLVKQPLSELSEAQLRPSKESLTAIMAELL
ncbi:2-oxoacid:ferredoxin oxidoreductase subunit beta [Anaerolineales bacterium HSG6]|nr:2-oxoacid:ferredoxin oxidoreductase subunit beta [Anaerolineales bacterium HSG6]MDM8530740.1 2-oxoacid:ferredoxin oxidoreductase subunit beta [Anaerolineales bacterium HSG25]